MKPLYIHALSALSSIEDLEKFPAMKQITPATNQLRVENIMIEGVPTLALRRMGKAVKLCLAAARPLLKHAGKEPAISVGTANGGMEDSIQFMNQIIDYEEGMLTPGNFVQSTPNGLASQLAFVSKNTSYNCTHTHRGLSFENALLDASLLTTDDPGKPVIVAGADEISTYNFQIDLQAGWYKTQVAGEFYRNGTSGTVAGEGAAAFVVTGENKNALAEIRAMDFGTLDKTMEIDVAVQFFLNEHCGGKSPDIFFSGENGDGRFDGLYDRATSVLDANCTVMRYKEASGEFPTASALAVYLAVKALQFQAVPDHFVMKGNPRGHWQSALICNLYQGETYSLILITAR